MLRVGALLLYCSSSPYSADEHAGVVTTVWMKARIEEDMDTSEGDSEPDAGSLDSIQMRVNIVCILLPGYLGLHLAGCPRSVSNNSEVSSYICHVG